MAVISLSAASRLRPSRIPTSTAMGMVTAKGIWQHEEKDFGHAAQRGAIADRHFQQSPQVLHEEDEGEKRPPEEGV